MDIVHEDSARNRPVGKDHFLSLEEPLFPRTASAASAAAAAPGIYSVEEPLGWGNSDWQAHSNQTVKQTDTLHV